MAPFLTKLALKFRVVDWNSDQLPTWYAAIVVAAICTYVAGFALSRLLPAEILPFKLIMPFLSRRKKVEVEDQSVPSTTHVILKCDLSPWQKAWYKRVTEDERRLLGNGRGARGRLQNHMVQLRKACNHPYLSVVQDYPEWNENIVRSSGKFELLDRVLPKLHRTGHRVLILSQMTACMTILEDYLSLKGYRFLRLDGSIRGADRDERIQQFNAPDSPCFIFNMSSRHRLDFHTADTIIMFDSDCPLPQMDHQLQKVKIFMLEEAILGRAKQSMSIAAISTAEERREKLVEIMDRGVDGLGADVPSEREINRLVARSDEEFWLFEKMDEERRRRENYRSRLIEEDEVRKIFDGFRIH